MMISLKEWTLTLIKKAITLETIQLKFFKIKKLSLYY
jgi:hypothetical protein